MDIHIAAYRNRIGNFNSSSHISYIPDISRKQSYKSRKNSYKSRTSSIYKFGKLTICMLIIISLLSRIEVLPRKIQDPSKEVNYVGPLSKSTSPISFIIFGGQVSASHFPINHLSFHDIPAVHSAATLQGVQAGHLVRGWIVLFFHFNIQYCTVW